MILRWPLLASAMGLLLRSVAASEATSLLFTVPEPALPPGWHPTGERADGRTPLTFRLQLRERNLPRVVAIARRVSDPTSPEYGHYLTQERLEELTAPAAEDTARVLAWLGATNVTWRGVSSLLVTTLAGEATRLLNTSFRLVQHADHPRPRMRAAGVSLPYGVAAIFGVHGLPLPKRRKSLPRTLWPPVPPGGGDPCHPQSYPITPDVLVAQYGVAGVTPKRSHKNRQAIVNVDGQFVNASDTALAFETWVADYERGTDDVVTFVGKHPGDCYDPQTGAYDGDCDIDSNLEIQHAMMLAPGVPTEFWETFWSFPEAVGVCDELYAWSSNLTSTADIPLVHSIAFAWQRNMSELCSSEALTAIDNNLAKLAAKGVTVLAASGDSGAGFEMGVPQCDAGGGLPESAQQGVQIEGTVAKAEVGTDLRSCCEVVQPGFPPTAAWTWEAPRPAPAPAPAPAQRRLQTSPGWPHLIGDYDFRNQSFCESSMPLCTMHAVV